MSTITAGTTSGQAIVVNGDTTGDLVFKTNNTITALTLGADQSAAFAGNVTVTGSVTSTAGLSSPVIVAGNSSAGAEIRLPEDTDNGTNYVALKAADALATNLTLTLPAADGTAGQVLQTDGSGTLSFGNVAAANGGTGLTSPGTAGNLLTSNGTTWTSATPLTSGTFDAIATGTLANGSTVIINVDGTVSAVTNQTQNVGTSTAFDGTATDGFLWVSATYDANAQKVVIAYTDRDNSNFGTAIVGTVSGTSISFGTAVVFQSVNAQHISATYDANAQKVVIAYRNGANSNFGTAIVGTVSGTSISFGTPVVYESATTDQVSATYDSVQQKIVIAYRDNGNSFYGTAIVGTVSGTSISFGTAVVFESAYTEKVSVTYDSVQQKIVVAYADGGNSNYGTAIVGTVSGTSISFGTAVVFNSGITINNSAIFEPNAQKVVIAYRNGANSNFGTAKVGTVSGTTISFGIAAVFESASTDQISATYDANAKQVVIGYCDVGNSYRGTFAVGTVSGTSISFATPVVFDSNSIENASTSNYAVYDSVNKIVVFAYTRSDKTGRAITIRVPLQNITSENFIGFSNAAYTDGQTATIQTVGSVDDAQSGLTPGQQYFVQLNGTLGLTAGSPSVFAGTAVSATKIIVKG